MKSVLNNLKKRNSLIDQLNEELIENIEIMFKESLDSLKNNHKIILIGNGGSFSIAQHISAEFTGRFISNRKSLPSIVLGSNPSSITAIANDFGYENSFSRELSSLGKKGDVLITMSVSGKSRNVLKALNLCRDLGIKSFFLTGESSQNEALSAITLKIPSNETALVQELHLCVLHELCSYVEDNLYKISD